MRPGARELTEPELAHISRTFSHMIEITKGKKQTDNETEKGRGNQEKRKDGGKGRWARGEWRVGGWGGGGGGRSC